MASLLKKPAKGGTPEMATQAQTMVQKVMGIFLRRPQTVELWQQTCPRDVISYTYLGFISGTLGNWEKALEEFRTALRLDPSNGGNYLNLGQDYMALNGLDEAEAVYKQAEERKL